MLNHNGGPPIDIDAKMRWVRINITDLLEGMDKLTWEQRGFYCTVLFKMYATMGGLPFDEREGARELHCDVRTYRRMRDVLIERRKVYVADGQIRNTRVEYEITEFCREAKRRRDAAMERERRKRNAAEDGKDPADFGQTSGRLPADFGEKSDEIPANFPETSRKKPKEINGCTATALPEREHSSGGNQKPETRNHHQSTTVDARIDPHVLYDRLAEAANGALYPLSVGLQVVAEPMGWIEHGADLERDILPVVSAMGKRARPQSIRSWSYFAQAVADNVAARQRGMPQPFKALAPRPSGPTVDEMYSDWRTSQ